MKIFDLFQTRRLPKRIEPEKEDLSGLSTPRVWRLVRAPRGPHLCRADGFQFATKRSSKHPGERGRDP